ncbi:MAG: hypothetical protein HYY08_00635 [Firmicutes bacterium]|nr:hypothetical protein [Bacillota bacterium]
MVKRSVVTTKRSLIMLVLVLGVALATGTLVLANADGHGDGAQAIAPGRLTGESLVKYLTILKAVAKYHDIEKAKADGYIPVGPVVPNMGQHYLNPQLAEKPLDLTRPPILEYVPDGTGNWYLIGVEFLSHPGHVPDETPLGIGAWDVHEAACHYKDGSEIKEASAEKCPKTNNGADLAEWHPDLVGYHIWLIPDAEGNVVSPMNTYLGALTAPPM